MWQPSASYQRCVPVGSISLSGRPEDGPWFLDGALVPKHSAARAREERLVQPTSLEVRGRRVRHICDVLLSPTRAIGNLERLRLQSASTKNGYILVSNAVGKQQDSVLVSFWFCVYAPKHKVSPALLCSRCIPDGQSWELSSNSWGNAGSRTPASRSALFIGPLSSAVRRPVVELKVRRVFTLNDTDLKTVDQTTDHCRHLIPRLLQRTWTNCNLVATYSKTSSCGKRVSRAGVQIESFLNRPPISHLSVAHLHRNMWKE